MSIRRAIFRRVQTTITLTTTAALAGLTGIAGLTLAPAAHADDSGVQVFAASTASSPTDPSLTAFYTPPATVTTSLPSIGAGDPSGPSAQARRT